MRKVKDWEILVAGQRVQTIKKDEYEGGVLRFGTEIVSSEDGKITCLLGASPGASTSVSIMMEVIEKAFPEILASNKGQEMLSKMIPSWDKPLEAESFKTNLKNAKEILKV